MAHNQKTRGQVRAKYIQGMPLATAAETCSVGYQTARNWKRLGKENGDDWDTARAARRLSKSGIEDLTSQVLEELTVQFLATFEAMKQHETMEPEKKAEILARLSDSYVKTVNAAGRANPALTELSRTMEVLKELNEFIGVKFAKHRAAFLEILEAYGQEVARKHG
jgi:transposase